MLSLARSPARSYGSLILARGIRMRANKYFSLDSEKEEDALLKKLEEKLARVRKRIEREEAEAKANGTDRKHIPPQPTPEPAAKPMESHNSSLWDELVSKEDQARLAKFGITSLDALEEVYQDADSDLNRPPYPSLQKLPPRLRLAHELYQSIPQKIAAKQMLANANRAKEKPSN